MEMNEMASQLQSVRTRALRVFTSIVAFGTSHTGKRSEDWSVLVSFEVSCLSWVSKQDISIFRAKIALSLPKEGRSSRAS